MRKNKFPCRPSVEVIEEVMSDGLIRKRTRTVYCKPTRTLQEPGAGCNINSIMAKYKTIGVNPFILEEDPNLYGSYNKSAELADALNIVVKARTQFDALPSEIRDRFKNDEMEMLKFLESNDEKDIAESYELGFRVKPVVEPEIIQKVMVITPELQKEGAK